MTQIRTYRRDDNSERNLETVRAALQAKFGHFITYSDCIRFALQEAAKQAEKERLSA